MIPIDRMPINKFHLQTCQRDILSYEHIIFTHSNTIPNNKPLHSAKICVWIKWKSNEIKNAIKNAHSVEKKEHVLNHVAAKWIFLQSYRFHQAKH